MPFARGSLQQISDRITSDFQNQITGATSLLRRSVLRVIARVCAGAFHLLYEYLDYQARQLFILTADEAGLETISSEYGVIRTAASEAIGSGTATGTNGILIPEGSELKSSSDQIYTTNEDATIVAGTAILNFTANVAGTDGNDDGGIILTFVSPIAGVNSSVTVDSDGIAGGSDIETDDALRARTLFRKRFPPHGGSSFDYKAWVLEVSGVTRVWIFSLYAGAGTVGIAFVRDNDINIIPNAAQRTAVLEYIIEHEDPITGMTIGCPVTAEPGLSIIELVKLTINLEIKIYPNTAEVQNSIKLELESLIFEEGGPGETIYLSEISEAISFAAGEERHKLIAPAVDVTATLTQIHSLGTITFSSY